MTKVVGWLCWCSGMNDDDASSCHICGTERPAAPELVTTEEAKESSQYEAKLEVVRQLQRVFYSLQDGVFAVCDPLRFVNACKVRARPVAP